MVPFSKWRRRLQCSAPWYVVKLWKMAQGRPKIMLLRSLKELIQPVWVWFLTTAGFIRLLGAQTRYATILNFPVYFTCWVYVGSNNLSSFSLICAMQERKSFDEKFVRIETERLCELTSAADSLQLKPLVDLTSRALARIIEGKTPEEIRDIFHLPDDLTEVRVPSIALDVKSLNTYCQNLHALRKRSWSP